ncbi:MAG: cytidyltransferase, partial [Methanobacteriales archaeon]|nr:cytidyltransferase [Methanobacteriales archaeon]
KFLERPRPLNGPLKSFKAGISLKRSEIGKLKEGTEAKIYVKENDIISCQIKDGMKIKSPLILPGEMATYLRLIIDSHFIPFNGKLIKENESFRVKISIG